MAKTWKTSGVVAPQLLCTLCIIEVADLKEPERRTVAKGYVSGARTLLRENANWPERLRAIIADIEITANAVELMDLRDLMHDLDTDARHEV